MKPHRPTFETCYQLLLFSCVFSSYYLSCPVHGITNGSHDGVTCFEKEREALLKFKKGIEVDRCGLLSSWDEDHEHSQNCCQWHGVRCSNHTGHVIVLNLRGVEAFDIEDSCLLGNVSSSLVDLKHLSYLDLSLNSFQGQPIPSFIGSLVNLKHLNLSHAGFEGEVPHQLGNLSSLTSLDLGSELVTNFFNLYVTNLSWLSRLVFLRYINLSNIDLSKSTNWLQMINKLSFLQVLYLENCKLPPPISWPLSSKSSSATLSVLSLSGNSLNDSSIIFQWLFNLTGINTHLSHLDLHTNQLKGPLPGAFGSLQALSYLDLSDNNLQGSIPISFGNMHSLSYLSLGQNRLESPIPDTISNIKPLTHLDLSSNKFQSFPKTLGDLCSLQELYLHNNTLIDELPNIIQTLLGCAKESLLSLRLSDNQIWGHIPDTIDTFYSLRELNLYDNRLNGTISQSLGNLSMLETLDLSFNSLKGNVTNNHFSKLSTLKDLDLSNNPSLVLDIDVDWIPPFQLESITLSSCKLGKLFPTWILSQTNYSWLDISVAGISDSIPKSFWNSLPSKLSFLNMSHNEIYGTLPDLQKLVPDIGSENLEIDLSFNNIEGAIPSFPISLTSLVLNNNKFSDPIPFLCSNSQTVLANLDLSNNLLSGDLPDCWMNFNSLLFLHLENNNFSGRIPASIGYLKYMVSLHLRDNRFSKELPRSFMNCTSLVTLDLGHNSLSGHIPAEIGNNLRSLSILVLRNNNFVGGIPLSLCQLSVLQILDLSINRIIGTIPKCIYNLTAMQNGTDLMPEFPFYDLVMIPDRTYSYREYVDAGTVMWKGEERSFMNSLGLVKAIDISQNKLHGEIPVEISFLAGLVTLNLSRNHLDGNITPIGSLTSLENLDLSNNHISGEIPESLAYLNSLGVLDLSNNNLSGKIPTLPQLQRFDASAYTGNSELCGLPLPICSWDQPPDNATNVDNNNHHDENDEENIFPGLYISIVLGFIIGFWGICGTLVLKTSWRNAFFRFFDDMKDKLYIMVYVKLANIFKGSCEE